jgi:hypothetical protein
MKTATSLALVAIGAIFAFAITRSPSFLNLQVVGWVLMLTGAIGAVIPRRGYGWLRRSLVVKNEDQIAAEATERSAASQQAAPSQQPVLPRQRFSRWLVPGGVISARGRAVPPTGQVERETIDEYIEE